MQLLSYSNFYLIGVKGVAMTSLAQCLLDAGKQVRGSDTHEKFVTEPILEKLAIKIDTDFNQPIPQDIDCVIYTAAHQGRSNPQVQQAIKQGLRVLSQAEALADFFNQKQGIAVCGVGGKSTVSAMIAWILHQVQPDSLSFSVGVGNIPGLEKTGQWSETSKFFVAEADEYVINPSEVSQGEVPIPRFSFLQPHITVCTNLKYDHPDVYKNFDQTQAVFKKFFGQIKAGGYLIINSDDRQLLHLAQQVGEDKKINIISFGELFPADFLLRNYRSQLGQTICNFLSDDMYQLMLQIPGKYNVINALSAIAACQAIGIEIEQSIKALATFHSTMRRFEYLGSKNGVTYYDDYAHHPTEIAAVIKAITEWYPHKRVVIAFQPHTFSRTKQLFAEFAQTLGTAQEVILLDIFASARENFDQSISSDLLVSEIKKHQPNVKIANLKTIQALANFCQTELTAGDVLITLGAGDIYQVHHLIKS